MVTWVRHRWCLEGLCAVAEAFVEDGSAADEQLTRHFDTTREVEVEYVSERETGRVMKGWVRLG